MSTTSFQRIHRPPLRQIGMTVLITGAVLLICPAILLVPTGGLRLFWALVGAFGIFAAYFFIMALQVRIVTSPEGIEYHQSGFRIRATWENVIAIEKVRIGSIQREGLRIQEPTINISTWYRFFGTHALRGHFIPITPLIRDWRNTSLGLDVRQYAPHLFDQESLNGVRNVG